MGSSQRSVDLLRTDTSETSRVVVISIELARFGLRVALFTLTTTPGGKDEVGGTGSKGNGYVWEDEKEYVAKKEPFNTQFKSKDNSVPVQVNCTCAWQNDPDDAGFDVNTRDF